MKERRKKAGRQEGMGRRENAEKMVNQGQGWADGGGVSGSLQAGGLCKAFGGCGYGDFYCDRSE